MIPRELTRKERAAIRKPVHSCANYDCQEKICLVLEEPCYMLQKVYNGALCRYFREAVLPMHSGLESIFVHAPANQKLCPVCGRTYIPKTSQAYCSIACKTVARRKSERDRKRRERRKKG